MANTLTKVSLRNVAAHKLRLALTVLAVVLGTAFLSGALMFTNMLSATFDSAVDTALEDVDAVVRPTEGSIDMDTFNAIEDTEGVDRVNVFVDEPVVVARQDEVAIQTQLGTSRLMPFYSEDEAVGRAPVLIDGSAPTAAGDIAVNANGAQKYGIAMGEKLIVVDKDGRNEFTVTGLYEDPLAQETSLVMRVGEQAYLDVYRDGASVPAVTVDGGAGVVDRLKAQFPELEVRAGADVAEEMSQQIREGLSFVSYFLVAFGLVGLLVGTFLIANTFSMIVAQRTREFALLRSLGASRGQITRSVAFESALVGLIGSALGVAGGVGLVALIRVAMARYGMPLPDAGTGLSTRAVVVPLVVGTLVTVLSALAPARKAGQVKPVEAMRSSEAATPQPLRWREWMARAEAVRPDGIRAVSVVTPNHLHAPVAVAFLEAGIHVICDKPLTATCEDAEALAEVARPGEQLEAGVPATAGHREVPTREHLGRTQQHTAGLPLGVAHQVQAAVDAVVQVHVRAPRRPEQRGIALGAAAERVGAGVRARVPVRLGLSQPHRDRAVRGDDGQPAPQQRRGERGRGAVEGGGETLRGHGSGPAAGSTMVSINRTGGTCAATRARASRRSGWHSSSGPSSAKVSRSTTTRWSSSTPGSSSTIRRAAWTSTGSPDAAASARERRARLRTSACSRPAASRRVLRLESARPSGERTMGTVRTSTSMSRSVARRRRTVSCCASFWPK